MSSRAKWGWRRLAGKRRMSTRVSTPAPESRAANASAARVPCPTVRRRTHPGCPSDTGAMTDEAVDHYVRLDSALGPVFVAYGADGVTALRPAGAPQAFESWFVARFGRPVSPAA